MPKVVTSFASVSRPGLSTPTILKFTTWGEGPIFIWYHGLADHKAKSIDTLQIWKDVSGAVPHRFIVIRTLDGRFHRFDRRPSWADDQTNTVGLLLNQAVTSEDSYLPNISETELAVIKGLCECEIEIFLNGQVDLMTVISACYAISTDKSASKYTFLQHNCFFFSWTILMVVSRYYLPYEVPQHESIMKRFDERLAELTTNIVDEAVALFRELIVETVAIFRDKSGAPLQADIVGRAAWNLSTEVIRFSFRRLFSIQLCGLRDQLTKMVMKEVRGAASRVHLEILSTHLAREHLDEHLWIEGTEPILMERLRKEITKIMWVSILEAISAGLGDAEPKQLASKLTGPHDLKLSLLGRDAAQLSAVWGAALHGGLRAAKEAGQHLSGLKHEDALKKAWDAARDAGLDTAKTVVQNTREASNKPERDATWERVWRIWEDCWKATYDIVQDRTVKVVDAIVEKILATVVDVLIEDIKQCDSKLVQAHMLNKVRSIRVQVSTIEVRILTNVATKERKWPSRTAKRRPNFTNAQLQTYMQNIIKKDTATSSVLDAVRLSMDRVWKEARQLSPLPEAALPPVAEYN